MRNTNLKFRLSVFLFLLTYLSIGLSAQDITIRGKVQDANHEPVIGASILVKGTTNGTITDLDGNYTLQASANATLVVTYVGYQTEQIAVDGRKQINIALKEDAKALEEVVVVGYGTARKSDVTGSIASVQGDIMREVPAANISYALQSRVAGVDMTQTSSKPGANMQIRIRGTRSLTASNDPLIVLDGIPFMGNLSDINPSDIKSMDILKDASSTAIYGSRGANGVILITTNKGSEGQPARVTYNGYFGLKSVFHDYPMMNGEEFAKLRQDANMFTNSLDESDTTNTNWQDMMYRTAIVTSHDVSVANGTKNGSYSVGVGYYYDESNIPTQSFERYNIRATIDQGIGDYLRFGASTITNYNITKGSQIGLYNVLSASPIATPYNEDGTLKRTIRMPLDEQWVMTKDVLNEVGESWVNESTAIGSYNTFYGQIECPWVKGLKYRINVGMNYRGGKTGAFTGEGINSSNATTESTASVQHTETTNWAEENMLTYDRTFAQKHQLNVVAMYSAEQTKYTKSYMSGKDIPASYFQYYNIGRADGEITVNPNNQAYEKSGLLSFMGRVMYAYDNKYMLMATIQIGRAHV